MALNPIRWLLKALTYKADPGSTDRMDPNDNQYRRMQFGFRGASGLNGQSLRRLNQFNNPKPLDEEDN